MFKILRQCFCFKQRQIFYDESVLGYRHPTNYLMKLRVLMINLDSLLGGFEKDFLKMRKGFSYGQLKNIAEVVSVIRT